MSFLVMKFGGTSVASVERIRNVARHVKREIDAGNRVAVVVSAMAGVTNQLVAWVREASPLHDAREYDAVVASGEQVTAGLLAIVLQSMGIQARSWQGWQIPIVTDDAHGVARIKDIPGGKIRARLEQGEVAVITGFQGIEPERNRISTLGRGGSDTSAVAVAVAVRADLCDIYTDVDGVYTTDPRIVPEARRLDKITFEEMLEMASLGSKVLQIRSVEFAGKYKVPLRVLSSFEEGPGTLITYEENDMEAPLISGIAFSRDEAKLTVRGVPDKPGIAHRLLGDIAAASINVDMIVQNVGADGTTDFTFTVPRGDYKKALEIVKKTAGQLAAREVTGDDKIVKISVVGVGMRSHAGIASQMFKTLADEGINIQMISTSEIKISVVVEEKYLELAVRALHNAFGLDRPAALGR